MGKASQREKGSDGEAMERVEEGHQGKQGLDSVLAIGSAEVSLHFYDANFDGRPDFGADRALNQDHRSAAGARKLGNRLDAVVDSILV